jgi:hypothetical protein
MTEELRLSLPTGREFVFDITVSPEELCVRPESEFLGEPNEVDFWAAVLTEPIKVPIILSAVQAPPINLQPLMAYESRTMSFFTWRGGGGMHIEVRNWNWRKYEHRREN